MKIIDNMTVKEFIEMIVMGREEMNKETKISYYRPAGKADAAIKLEGSFPCRMVGLEDLMVTLLKDCPDSQENNLNTFVESVRKNLRSVKHEGD